MRLIDYDKAWVELVYAHEPYAADLIQMMPTIDPETLPIVRKLRDELERVAEERDAALMKTSCDAQTRKNAWK